MGRSSKRRNNRKALAERTLQILDQGYYSLPSGQRVEVEADLRHAIENTTSYPPDHAPPGGHSPLDRATRIEVINQTSLQAARQMTDDRGEPMVLNFASAKNPGGGFLGGSQAQEESLARSSGLYACIRGHEMYAYHRHQRGAWYSDWMIYSPQVPVFCTDDGELLEQPYLCSFLTAPAVNKGALKKSGKKRSLREEMDKRVRKVLQIAAAHEHRRLVLGAWGCGVFRNNPETIAGLFAQALHDEFIDSFAWVRFAVLDHSRDLEILRAFADALGVDPIEE